MKPWVQIYYNAVFGAIGGLIGWFIVGVFPTGDWNIWVAYPFVGAGVGLCIGGTTGAVTGLVVQRTLRRTLRGAVLGSIVGLISGTVGLLMGEGFFLILGGGIIGRTLGWIFLGLFLGVGDGLVSRKLRRAGYGLIGGTIAGLVGGAAYESLTQLFITQSDTVQMIVGALGLVLIGACLGGIIPLAVDFLDIVGGKGTLTVKKGKRPGDAISVVDPVTLGSSDSCDMYLPGDPGIAKKHAVVSKDKGKFYVRDLGSGRGTSVNNRPVTDQQPGHALRSGETIHLGQTEVLFEANKK